MSQIDFKKLWKTVIADENSIDSKDISQIDFKKLWKIVIANKKRINSNIHGPRHWARVERNGLYLCQLNGADETVVRLFALFHDSMRENDGRDIEHGLRAAKYAQSLLGKEYQLATDRFDLLYYACQYHTKERTTEDKTIGTCWDADRLDIGRIFMMKPSAHYMNSSEAKQIIAKKEWKFLYKAEKLVTLKNLL